MIRLQKAITIHMYQILQNMLVLKKLRNLWCRLSWSIPYLPWSIYLNFHYLPFYQAIKLPILVSKPNFVKLGGKIKIEGVIYTGMIELGRHSVSTYPQHGIMIDNSGTIIFKGRCLIRSGAKISVGEKGTLTIGNNFKASAENKFICYKAVTLGDNVSMGWESMLMDTNFHQTLDSNGNPHGRPYAPISIGDYCWLGFRTVCMPNTRIPNKCILASNSLANKNYDIEEYSLLAGSPAKVKATGIWRDPANDKVIYI